MRLLIASVAAALITGSAGAVTIVNGSFEDGVVLPDGGFTTLATGDTTSLPGWEVLSQGIDYIGTYWQAAEGTRSLDLSALTAGGVMQRVTGFEVGKHYRITFSLSANPGETTRPKRILVSATGGSPRIYDYANTTNSNGDMMYETHTYDFIAGGPTQNVQFRSEELNPYGPVLDNVSIALVPEPATWGLMLAGFGLTGILVRRRARSQSLAA